MPEDPKLAEFRDKNVALMKEVEDLKKKYDGIDPEVVKADRLKLTELEKVRPERMTELEGQLAAEKAAHATTRKEADASLLDSKISDTFLKAGGRPEARAFIVAQSAGQFVVEKGEVKGTKHSPDRPGELMTLAEWITLQIRAHSYTFFPSSGGGANPSRGNSSTDGKVLRNPSPQDLGKYSREISSGEMKVQYD